MCKKSVMKRLLAFILIGFSVFGFIMVDAASANAALTWETPTLYLADAPVQSGKDWMTQLETEILPQIEEIFNPEQRQQFQASIADGVSFRKAFKSLMLTPEQKTQIRTVLNSASKKDALASLTPEQKKQLFLKKKEMFMPTTEEVTQKIEASLKDKGVELPEGVREKIDAGLRMKENFIPTAATVTEPIEAAVSMPEAPIEE